MRAADRPTRRSIQVAAVVALVLSALFGPSLHLLQHTASADTPARTCACVHDASAELNHFPAHPSAAEPPASPTGHHDPDTCSVCLTFFLQTHSIEHAQDLRAVPIEIRRILPHDSIGSGPSIKIAAARGPPRD
ncbi:MAG: hypothetical protein ACKO2L_16300 [Planctomycetaceae bacterium]